MEEEARIWSGDSLIKFPEGDGGGLVAGSVGGAGAKTRALKDPGANRSGADLRLVYLPKLDNCIVETRSNR